ncbi:hypothetical protein GJ744_001246 [Endocarpon pusillum]|uniref:Heterokaryon incompatibility domain-containing protein n=1 Tax=Endocarpon pusillum TaxID=364733 RepID=A0A8H7E3E8_9EURO|nr:hypothetical protein GJ744_001246 [Endocarpon pusillum]
MFLLDDGVRPRSDLSNSLISVYSGEKGTNVWGNLRLYALEDNPSAMYLLGREIARDPDRESNYRAIQQWLSFCDKNHTCCRALLPPLPARILDVGPPDGSADPALLISQGRSGLYVALSYCWGKGQTVVTTQQNLEDFREGIPISALSQSLQDAIKITRKIGLRYLWIDALCIVQQEHGLEDFLVESSKMGEYYSNAYLTLGAGSAADSQDGFLTLREPPAARPVRLVYSLPADSRSENMSHASSFVYACLSRVSGREFKPLDARAWVLQEQIMSPRMLTYGQEQMRFRCQRRIFCEDGSYQSFKWSPGTIDIYLRISERAEVMARHPNALMAKAEMFDRWNAIVEFYTRRKLTDPYDKLTALAAVAKALHHTVECNYLFGLWEDDLIRGLLWSNFIFTSSISRLLQRCETNRAPSWSWASVEGAVYTKHIHRQRDRYVNSQNHRIKILAYSTTTISFDPIRMRSPFLLRFQGILKPVRSSRTGIAQYKFKNWVPTRLPNPQVPGVLLRSAEDSGGETDTSVESEVVGAGLFDVSEEASASLWCTRLVIKEGLLLAPAAGGVYRRLGVFWVQDVDWFDRGEVEEFAIT